MSKEVVPLFKETDKGYYGCPLGLSILKYTISNHPQWVRFWKPYKDLVCGKSRYSNFEYYRFDSEKLGGFTTISREEFKHEILKRKTKIAQLL